MDTSKFEQVPVDKLVPYARNARTHSKQQIAQLRASIREFGFVSPVEDTFDQCVFVERNGQRFEYKDLAKEVETPGHA